MIFYEIDMIVLSYILINYTKNKFYDTMNKRKYLILNRYMLKFLLMPKYNKNTQNLRIHALILVFPRPYVKIFQILYM